MNARFKMENPKAAEYTLTLTMTAKEWEELRDQLAEKWPSSRLSSVISDLLAQARRIFWAEPVSTSLGTGDTDHG